MGLIPNIYNNKKYKYYPILPIALLIISLFFIPHIQLDQSLRGGISIQIQTNSTLSTQQITDMINSKIVGAQASVTKSPGSMTVIISSNQSISSAHTYLLDLYSLNDSYTAQSFTIAQLNQELKSGPNSTASAELSTTQANQTKTLSSMSTTLSQELAVLRPFIGNSTFDSNQTASGYVDAGAAAYASSSAMYQNTILSTLKQIVPFTVYSYQDVTPTLGAFFLQELETVILVSFVLVAIAVFIIFRNPIPSLTVVFGSANDIIVALGAMAILGIPLGVASVGGLLMLIGYSMDTDILVAIRVLKRTEGTPEERAFDSMKTGITLTVAAIITFSILLVISYVVYIPTYFEISGIVLVGLIADLITTWLNNTPLLLWYKEKKHGAR